MSVPGDAVIYEYLNNLDYRLECEYVEFERRYALRKLDPVDHLEIIILQAKRELFDKMQHDIVSLMRCARDNNNV